MDELDLRILGSLAWKPGDPAHMARGILRPWDIARALGVHGNTVKARLDEMRAAGLLKGVYLVPAMALASVSDMGMFWFEFDGPQEKLAAEQKLRGMEHVNDVHTFVGGTMRVALLAFRGQALEDVAERTRVALGARETRLFYRRAARGLPRPEPERLTPLDLRILIALVPDAHRPFPEVAQEVGVTPKTVRLRFQAMLRSPVFAIIPHVDLGRMRDMLAFELAAEFDGPDAARNARFQAQFPSAFMRSTPHADNVYLYLAVRDAAGMEEHVLRAQAFPGVRRVRALLCRETWTNNENLVRVLRQRLAELEGAA